MQWADVKALVRAERHRQIELWGDQSGTAPHKRMSILTEEVGEVAHALLEGDTPNLREELVQVAAVAVAWLEEEF